MSKIEAIIEALNLALIASIQPQFTEGTMLFNNIVKPIYKQNEIVNTISKKNALQNVVFSDMHTLQVYHKISAPISVERQVNDSQSLIKSIARVQCIIYTKHERHAFLESFVSAFPTILRIAGISGVTLNTAMLDLNELQIFAEERGSIPYNLNPSWQLAKLEYVVTYTYKDC